MREENRGVTLKRRPHSDIKDACIKQCSCWSPLCKYVFIDCRLC